MSDDPPPPPKGVESADPCSRAAPLIERAPLPMVEVEGAAHIVCFVNPAFCRLLQKTPQELVGRPFGEIVCNGDRCVPLLDRVYETGEFETHVELDGSEANPAYWFFAMWPALGKDAQPERVVIQLTRSSHFHQNVAAMNEALMLSAVRQHELREAAERSNAQLQVEIAERKVAGDVLHDAVDRLEAAQRAAEQGSRAKDDFLAALSHELRTPLTPVLLIAAALREDGRLPPEVREQLGMIERNIGLEARLIDDLLDLTKISHGKLEFRPEPCDAHRLIAFAMDIVQAEAAAKGIVVRCSLQAEHSALTADPTRFQQVIWNLLRNAVKFTPAGGDVCVRTRNETGASGMPWLRVEVADSGIGIPAERLEEIFQPFDQGGLTGDHRFGGVGLGLAIARAVVDLHKGRISARSGGRNRGATLIVELPCATIAPVQLPDGMRSASTSLPQDSTSTTARTGAALRILVVEDHVSTLHVLRWLLERDGHQVTTAATVGAALAAAAAKTFDLVITDLGLPDGTGTDLMRKLRATQALQGIALSGYGMDEDVARSEAVGFVTHLTKPVAIADLRRAIASLPPVEAREDE
jgi:signal transduction histidine kinase/ActR/RegA family two-component response regulator